MTEPKSSLPPKITLQEMKRRLAQAQPVNVESEDDEQQIAQRMSTGDELVVDQLGRLHTPTDQGMAKTPLQNKTVVKPQRWFSRPVQSQHRFWYESNPARLVQEKKVMEMRFPHFQLVRDGDQLVWVGTLVSNRGNEYEIAVYYPDDFPNAIPQVYPINPPITSWEDQQAGTLKHQWADGSLCLYYPDDRNFNANTTAATIIAIAAAWFFAYETWKATGIWPGFEAPHIQE